MIDVFFSSWDWWEPILGWITFVAEVVVMAFAALYLLRVQKAKRKRFAEMSDDHLYIVLQVGQPVVAAFTKQFDVVPNYVIDPEVTLGHLVLEGQKDYSKLVKEFRDILKANQDKEVRVITSGPSALNALLGQSAGVSYDIVWYQFDLATGEYSPIPPLDSIL